MDKLRSIGIKSIPKGNKSVRAYNSIRYPKIPLSANDLYVIATVGDRVDLIADQYYNDKGEFTGNKVKQVEGKKFWSEGDIQSAGLF